MSIKYPYKSWLTILLNIWVIALLAGSIILLINNLILPGILSIIITSFVVKSVLNRNKRYNQIMLSLSISETTCEREDIADYDKKYIKSHIKDLYTKYINYKEFWNEDSHDKYWPKKIPFGVYLIYGLAQYWSDTDISKNAIQREEMRYAYNTRDDANKFLRAIKESEERDSDRLERLAEKTGKNYWDIVDSEREIEQKKSDEKNRKKAEEEDKILDNSAKMIFTGVTGKCPFCLKNISMFAVKCPHCTADLRKQ